MKTSFSMAGGGGSAMPAGPSTDGSVVGATAPARNPLASSGGSARAMSAADTPKAGSTRRVVYAPQALSDADAAGGAAAAAGYSSFGAGAAQAALTAGDGRSKGGGDTSAAAGAGIEDAGGRMAFASQARRKVDTAKPAAAKVAPAPKVVHDDDW